MTWKIIIRSSGEIKKLKLKAQDCLIINCEDKYPWHYHRGSTGVDEHDQKELNVKSKPAKSI